MDVEVAGLLTKESGRYVRKVITIIVRATSSWVHSLCQVTALCLLVDCTGTWYSQWSNSFISVTRPRSRNNDIPTCLNQQDKLKSVSKSEHAQRPLFVVVGRHSEKTTYLWKINDSQLWIIKRFILRLQSASVSSTSLLCLLPWLMPRT